MSIQLIILFVFCMLMAVMAAWGPVALAGPAGMLCGVGLLVFLSGVIVRGVRRPVV